MCAKRAEDILRTKVAMGGLTFFVMGGKGPDGAGSPPHSGPPCPPICPHTQHTSFRGENRGNKIGRRGDKQRGGRKRWSGGGCLDKFLKKAPLIHARLEICLNPLCSGWIKFISHKNTNY